MDDKTNADKLILLWIFMFFCLIKYNESNKSKVHVPLMIALSAGRK